MYLRCFHIHFCWYWIISPIVSIDYRFQFFSNFPSACFLNVIFTEGNASFLSCGIALVGYSLFSSLKKTYLNQFAPSISHLSRSKVPIAAVVVGYNTSLAKFTFRKSLLWYRYLLPFHSMRKPNGNGLVLQRFIVFLYECYSRAVEYLRLLITVDMGALFLRQHYTPDKSPNLQIALSKRDGRPVGNFLRIIFWK